MLISQTKRCGEILKKISKKQIKDDEFFSKTRLEDLLSELISSFRESSSKQINLESEHDKNKISFQRSPEIIYGLRNFIGNAIKFSKTKVDIILSSNKKDIEILIKDDGPGFPADVIEILGEPYIKSKSSEINDNAGTGLGTFLGKTLLERSGAKLSFLNDKNNKGALEKIPDHLVDELIVNGTPDQCREHIQRYVEAGVTCPALAIMPLTGDDVRQSVRDLAPIKK